MTDGALLLQLQLMMPEIVSWSFKLDAIQTTITQLSLSWKLLLGQIKDNILTTTPPPLFFGKSSSPCIILPSTGRFSVWHNENNLSQERDRFHSALMRWIDGFLIGGNKGNLALIYWAKGMEILMEKNTHQTSPMDVVRLWNNYIIFRLFCTITRVTEHFFAKLCSYCVLLKDDT